MLIVAQFARFGKSPLGEKKPPGKGGAAAGYISI
jgi:hypothetical protein